MTEETIEFSIRAHAGGFTDSYVTSFHEVPKGTTVGEICELLEVNHLNTLFYTYKYYVRGKLDNMDQEMLPGDYQIPSSKRYNTDRIDEKFPK